MPGKRSFCITFAKRFLDYFGINSTAELPKLKDILPQPDGQVIGDVPEVISDRPTKDIEPENAGNWR